MASMLSVSVALIIFLLQSTYGSYKCIVVAGADNVNAYLQPNTTRPANWRKIVPYIEVTADFDDSMSNPYTYTTIQQQLPDDYSNKTIMNMGIFNYTQNLSNPRWMNTKCFYKPISMISFTIHSCDDDTLCTYNTFQISVKETYHFGLDYENDYIYDTNYDDSGILTQSPIKLKDCSSCDAILYYRLYRSFGPCLSLNSLNFKAISGNEYDKAFASIWIQRNAQSLPPPNLMNIASNERTTNTLKNVHFLTSFNTLKNNDNSDIDAIEYYDYYKTDSFDAGLLICAADQYWNRITVDFFGVNDEIYTFNKLIYFNLIRRYNDDFNVSQSTLEYPSQIGLSNHSSFTQCIIKDYSKTSLNRIIDEENIELYYSMYWQNCIPNDIEIIPENDKLKLEQTVLSIQSGIAYFFMGLTILSVLLVFIGIILWYRKYRGGDFLNGFAIIWFLMEIWDYWSDLLFVLLLYSLSIWNLFIPAVVFVVVPYLCNLYYLAQNTKRWSTGNAPGYSRKWLVYWSWILVALTMITGGVHPAVELVNSTLFPHDIFCMHLTYNEIIRVRTERFLTNVVIENIPQVIVQIFYLLSPIYDSSTSVWIVYLTLASSVSSIIFSGTYFFATCSRDVPDKPIYVFKIVVKCNEFADKSYFIHAHWNFATAIQKAFDHRDPNYIVIDDVSKLLKEITIKGRVLEDIIFEDTDSHKMGKIDKKTLFGKNKNTDKLKKALAEILQIDVSLLDIKTFDVSKIKKDEDKQLFGTSTIISSPKVVKKYIIKDADDSNTSIQINNKKDVTTDDVPPKGTIKLEKIESSSTNGTPSKMKELLTRFSPQSKAVVAEELSSND